MARVAPALLALLVWSGTSFAVAPQSISGLTSANSLSPDEVRKIESYVNDLLRRLRNAADDPAEVREIRRDLVQPVSRGGVTEIFLDKYTRASISSLDDIVTDGNAHTSVVALIVMSNLGTERALDQLVRHVSIRDDQRRHVRLAAARGCSQLFRNKHLQDAMPKKVTGAARRIAAAAKVETDAMTLRHQALAIFHAGQMPKLPPASQDQIRAYLIEVLDSVTERAAAADIEDDPIGMVAAVYHVLLQMRGAYLQTSTQAQKDFGRQLGPRLRAILDVANQHWAAAQETPRPDGQPGYTINICERFLTLIDGVVRGGGAQSPKTALKQWWDRGDKTQYDRDLSEWRNVLSQPPY
jgi:hypothetical protein